MPPASAADFDATGFAGATGTVLVLLLVLARASQSMIVTDDEPDGEVDDRPNTEVDDEPEVSMAEASDESGTVEDREIPRSKPRPRAETTGERSSEPSRAYTTGDSMPTARDPSAPGAGEAPPPAGVDAGADAGSPVEEMTTAALLANVAISHGVLAVVLVGGAILTAVPPAALGVHAPTAATFGIGVGLGAALYVASEVGAAVSERAGLGRDETLREMLAPESTGGWLLLLGGVLPVIAGFEELLFRGALIGALSVGFGVSPWLLAVLSSVAFGYGHGVQGASGIVVTGVLGFVLAAAFVLTGSLVVVVVAHYVVNALEFLVHEGLGIEWLDGS